MLAASKSAPFEILDNSFLVEEAFNQEAGIFQNIFGFQRTGDVWSLRSRRNGPSPSQKHQLSYTLRALGTPNGRLDFGDVMINYRYQATVEGPGIPAFSPRVSLILPTDGSGDRSIGLQINLPLSKQSGDLYFHGNAGFTWLPRARGPAERVSLLTPIVSGSAIYRLRPMFNLMLESVLSFAAVHGELGSTERETVFTISPGARGGWNLGDQQLILGAAIPITFADETNTGVFLYLSYELPFKK